MSRKIFFPRPEVEKLSLTSSPCPHYPRRSVLLFCPVVLGRCSISAASSSFSSDERRSVSETGKRGGCTVSTMDLSEARGLVLFRVIREGIGISQRLSATDTCAPTGDWDAHPRNRTSQEPTGHHQTKITGDGKGSSPETLKRLAILVSQRRSFLPSSKVLA